MIEGTVVDQRRAVYWHQRRQERMTPRKLLRESDELMFWIEECMVQRLRVIPGWLMPRLVTLLARADTRLPREMGSERRPEQVVEFLYRAQEMLMDQSVRSREPAPIIPLFRYRPQSPWIRAGCGSICTYTRASRPTARPAWRGWLPGAVSWVWTGSPSPTTTLRPGPPRRS